MLIAKRPSDVRFTTSITSLVQGTGSPLVAILTKNAEVKTKATNYSNIYDLANDYSEDTDVYKTAEAMFQVSGFNGPVEIIAYPNADVSNPTNVQKDGSKVSAETVKGIIDGINRHIFDGFKYVTTDKSVSSDDLTSLSDYLYDNQRGFLYVQHSSIDDMEKLSKHAQNYATDDNKIGNTGGAVVLSDKKAVAQMIAFASVNLPTDFAHIGNLSYMKPDDGLNMDDYDRIDSLNGSVVVNKANDFMSNSGKAYAGNFVDQFVNSMAVLDDVQMGLQKFINSQKFPVYNDDTINLMKQIIDGVSNKYMQLGVLSKAIVVTQIPVAEVSNEDIAKRTYNGFVIEYQVNDDVQKLNAKANITV